MVATIRGALPPCPDDSDLLSYAQGDLERDAREALELHLGGCAACCELVAETAKLLDEEPMPSGLPAPGSAIEPPDAPLGAEVGRYQLRSILGRGGTGVVYAAHDPELHRRVAIKLLRSDVLERGTDDGRARLLREARAMARVSHPHVVAIYDIGVWSDQVFVAMELVEGRTLRRVFADGGVAWQTRLRRVIEAGRGLCAAHAVGLVHRDFKPENVLVGQDGRARVTDFGLAKPVRGEEFARGLRSKSMVEILTTVTLTGRTSGTPAYMAPEQFLDAGGDARVDQFALAVVLHEAVWGVRPFAGKAVADIAKNVLESRVCEVPAAQPVDVPEALRAIVLRGVARDPDQRWPSCDAMLDALEAAIRAPVAAVAAVNEDTVPSPGRGQRPSPTTRVIGASAAVLLLAVGGGIWAVRRPADAASRRDDAASAPLVASSSATPSSSPVVAAPPDHEAAARPVTSEARAPSSTDHTAKARASTPRGTTAGSRTAPRTGATTKPLGDRVENPF